MDVHGMFLVHHGVKVQLVGPSLLVCHMQMLVGVDLVDSTSMELLVIHNHRKTVSVIHVHNQSTVCQMKKLV